MESVVTVRDLRMRYGENDVLTGVDFEVRAGEVVCLLGPNGAGKTTTIEILEGFRIRSAGEVTVLSQDPAHATEDWRARTGVVLQSWRDHPRWTPRRLLRAVLHPEAAALVRRGPAARHRRPDRPGGPQAHHALRRAASAARPGHRHHRTPRAAVPRRAHRRLRPAGAPGFPPAGTAAGRTGGHHDPAHHARPRRGREARGPGPGPRRRADRGRRHRHGSGEPGRREAEVRWSVLGERYVHASGDATAFVRDIFARDGEAVRDLEIRRASLEDAYLALVQQHEAGHADAAARLFTEVTG